MNDQKAEVEYYLLKQSSGARELAAIKNNIILSLWEHNTRRLIEKLINGGEEEKEMLEYGKHMDETEGARPRGVDHAEVVPVVHTVSIRGTGITQDDPVRQVHQYWSTDGELLAEKDVITDK